jgi:uncharacterized protein (DUF4415 family)
MREGVPGCSKVERWNGRLSRARGWLSRCRGQPPAWGVTCNGIHHVPVSAGQAALHVTKAAANLSEAKDRGARIRNGEDVSEPLARGHEMPIDRTRRTTTSRDQAEAAFKAATTKPAEPAPKRPSPPGAKEQVSLRIDRDVLDYFQEAGPGWQDRINEALRRAAGK